jgi:hypothetical protein
MNGARRLQRRRQFGLGLLPVAVLPLAAGVILAGKRGLLGVPGLVALAQGIGLGVAAVSLALGHNPVDARRAGRRSE